jgi:hypothetical protein
MSDTEQVAKAAVAEVKKRLKAMPLPSGWSLGDGPRGPRIVAADRNDLYIEIDAAAPMTPFNYNRSLKQVNVKWREVRDMLWPCRVFRVRKDGTFNIDGIMTLVTETVVRLAAEHTSRKGAENEKEERENEWRNNVLAVLNKQEIDYRMDGDEYVIERPGVRVELGCLGETIVDVQAKARTFVWGIDWQVEARRLCYVNELASVLRTVLEGNLL